jgi:Ca2+-binding EF-hand superfamily protein
LGIVVDPQDCSVLLIFVGTVDLYEFLMTMATLTVDDTQTQMKWLFSLCDSDRDGLVCKVEVVEVLTNLMAVGGADPASGQPSEAEILKTKSLFEE